MSKVTANQKGVIMYMVLVSILMTVILACIILNIISSQARLSHHEVSRVQAYYAAMAGVNFAIEKLRTGSEAACWPATAVTRHICRSNTTPQVCTTYCDPIDDNLPTTIKQVDISVAVASGSPPSRRIDVTAIYTYTP
jgi:Tfp pilus assembly protein PilX